MDLKETPESLIIIGAGPEGLEFAQMFAHFGSKVTVVIARGHQVLRREEPEIVNELLRTFHAEGIQFVADVGLEEVHEDSGRKVVTISTDDGQRKLVADELLPAAGIEANVSGLGLDRAGISLARIHRRTPMDGERKAEGG